jgi:hypothetical protein
MSTDDEVPLSYYLLITSFSVLALLLCAVCGYVLFVLLHYGTAPLSQKKASARTESNPLLKNTARDFAACLLPGGDVDIYLFERSCRSFAGLLDEMGFVGRLMASESRANLDKVRHSLAVCELETGMPPGKSLRALYRWEKKKKLHLPAGFIADPSAAMGVLWSRHGARTACTPPCPPIARTAQRREPSLPSLRRVQTTPPTAARAGLQTWLNFFNLCIAAAEPNDCAPLMQQAIDASHGELVGWWSRQAVAIAHRTMGSWEALAQTVGPSRAETERDAKQWCAAVSAVITPLKELQREFDYEDTRRS